MRARKSDECENDYPLWKIRLSVVCGEKRERFFWVRHLALRSKKEALAIFFVQCSCSTRARKEYGRSTNTLNNTERARALLLWMDERVRVFLFLCAVPWWAFCHFNNAILIKRVQREDICQGCSFVSGTNRAHFCCCAVLYVTPPSEISFPRGTSES